MLVFTTKTKQQRNPSMQLEEINQKVLTKGYLNFDLKDTEISSSNTIKIRLSKITKENFTHM